MAARLLRFRSRPGVIRQSLPLQPQAVLATSLQAGKRASFDAQSRRLAKRFRSSFAIFRAWGLSATNRGLCSVDLVVSAQPNGGNVRAMQSPNRSLQLTAQNAAAFWVPSAGYASSGGN